MPTDNETAILNVEEESISKLLDISCKSSSLLSDRSVCFSCGRPQNQSTIHDDLSRWSYRKDASSLQSLWNNRPFCDCKNEMEFHGKSDSFKYKKKQFVDLNGRGRQSQSTSVKDFIAHNKMFCNGLKNRSSMDDQKIYHFIHHKNSRNYIEKYRRNKLKKLEEESCFHLDQSSFDNELFSSLSKSISSIITDGQIDTQHSIDTIGQNMQSRLKLDTQKCNSPSLNFQSDSSLTNQQRSKYLDFCMKCGDNVKKFQETTFVTRTSNQEKTEEKKMKKLSKRISDQRPKITSDKNASDLPRQTIELAPSSTLQPVCHQIPIRVSASTEKSSMLKRDDWKGHPSSTKPTFSDRAGRNPDPRKKPSLSGLGKSLEYTNVFNTYGEKHNLMKESTYINAKQF